MDLTGSTNTLLHQYYGQSPSKFTDGNKETAEHLCAGTWSQTSPHASENGWIRTTFNGDKVVVGVHMYACSPGEDGYGCGTNQKCQIKVSHTILTTLTSSLFLLPLVVDVRLYAIGSGPLTVDKAHGTKMEDHCDQRNL